ncbi:hypothetical protein [Ralstonia pseudosolanacearum]|uniref:hypothetical protein n=1 Tax=Ralstonia pseudosolanacearum TaxID=1310165 RepID=UPI003CF3D24D
MQVSVNNQQRLFVIPAGGGFTCLGFDVCYRESLALALAMGLKEKCPKESEVGTIGQYNQYRHLINLAGQHPAFKTTTWFNMETPMRVREILENARLRKFRIRIFYGDVETGRDWLSEYDVVGRVGRSGGILKVPLMIATSSSTGGPAILDSRILRIIDCESKLELYRHPLYQAPVFEAVSADQLELARDGYVAAVKVNGAVHAHFKKDSSAARWIAFMKGERMNK